ncbi:hypothetical protein L1987_71435 [Smallanthus sonchifolius]|uniref:Uncharacterized protein n=1 Tax=Smallanthus sonchifolius TaxID=185202 RepID=A0ACB9ARM2_9ASTR|nr:hypothetical protein L1987_71435 [Smallanthus sonchifolius]
MGFNATRLDNREAFFSNPNISPASTITSTQNFQFVSIAQKFQLRMSIDREAMEGGGISEMEFTDLHVAADSIDASVMFHLVMDILGFVHFMQQQKPSTLFTFSPREVEGPEKMEDPDEPGPPPEISFRLFNQLHEMTMARFAVLISLYTKPETVTPLYTEGIT